MARASCCLPVCLLLSSTGKRVCPCHPQWDAPGRLRGCTELPDRPTKKTGLARETQALHAGVTSGRLHNADGRERRDPYFKKGVLQPPRPPTSNGVGTSFGAVLKSPQGPLSAQPIQALSSIAAAPMRPAHYSIGKRLWETFNERLSRRIKHARRPRCGYPTRSGSPVSSHHGWCSGRPLPWGCRSHFLW